MDHPERRSIGPVLELRKIGKSFHDVPAVVDADLVVGAGETVAVVGENGAGKSTLMKIVAGVYPADSFIGDILLDGVSRRFANVREAEAAGIVLVPQELYVAPNLSIAENMFMGALPGRFGFVDDRRLEALARERLAFFGIEADPVAPAGTLSPSEQRMITIAAALARSATRILILDEPTAPLTASEAEHLFAKMRQIVAQGVGCIYITHRLDEIDQVADRVVVMRNGWVVAHHLRATGSKSAIIRDMIGRDPEPQKRRQATDGGEPLLSVVNLRVYEPNGARRARVDRVTFSLFAGEILGMFGLIGAGRTQLAKAVFGAWPGQVEGEITIAGVAGRPASPDEAIEKGIGMLTEDRKQTGLFEGHSVLSNMSAASIDRVCWGPFIDLHKEVDRDRDLAQRLDVRPRRLDLNIEALSGGNQQKVLLARWIASNPLVLIVDEPTLGVDIGARFELYRLLREIASDGRGVLMISSDINEIIDEADRILVMYKGKITGSFSSGASRHELMAAATGQERYYGG
jgi:ABC-type sugar transport system ATPase subunit